MGLVVEYWTSESAAMSVFQTTAAEVVAGLLSGSLALIGDAVHNFSDAGALLVALVARRWSRRQPDELRTFGYRRASIVGAMINLTVLVVVGLYLLGGAFVVAGMIVVVQASKD